ncbi:hypothetical protein [Streptomyces sp. AHA2]|uniref:hypothetical protein n=1 Tax=Streptomyces sp. AHA2 TaxID=3064526 RepID=UPI002FE38A56
MTTRLDGDRGDEGCRPDDPLAVLLRPSSPDYLTAPAGQFAAVRRRAVRRRLLRTAAGAGVCCAVAALVALPLRLPAPDAPVAPTTVPMAPPDPSTAPSAPSAPPAPAPSRAPRASNAPAESRGPTASGVPSRPGARDRGEPSTPAGPSRTPSVTPTPARPAPPTARPTTDGERTPGR